ncbi:hypothetical protein V8C86DRAFT_2793494 [Haematococcus lacustris]
MPGPAPVPHMQGQQQVSSAPPASAQQQPAHHLNASTSSSNTQQVVDAVGNSSRLEAGMEGCRPPGSGGVGGGPRGGGLGAAGPLALLLPVLAAAALAPPPPVHGARQEAGWPAAAAPAGPCQPAAQPWQSLGMRGEGGLGSRPTPPAGQASAPQQLLPLDLSSVYTSHPASWPPGRHSTQGGSLAPPKELGRLSQQQQQQQGQGGQGGPPSPLQHVQCLGSLASSPTAGQRRAAGQGDLQPCLAAASSPQLQGPAGMCPSSWAKPGMSSSSPSPG